MEHYQVILCFFSFVGHIQNFPLAVCLATLAMFSKSFHQFGTVANVLDIAPKHSGSVFGIVNSAGGISGCKFKKTWKICFHRKSYSTSKFYIKHNLFNILGFVGVYLAGYILELTGSWSAVFNVTAVINLFGIFVFTTFGSGVPIVWFFKIDLDRDCDNFLIVAYNILTLFVELWNTMFKFERDILMIFCCCFNSSILSNYFVMLERVILGSIGNQFQPHYEVHATWV